MHIGTVSQLFRYPIKSMLGEQQSHIDVSNQGFVGDRVFALQDVETGKIVSSKLPYKWRKMLLLRAHYTSASVVVTWPDGSTTDIVDPLFEGQISDFLGRAVRVVDRRCAGMALDRADPDAFSKADGTTEDAATVLEIGMAAPVGGFFDFAPVHIILSSSLAKISELTLTGQNDVARFRPNIVLETNCLSAFSENAWVSATIKIGKVVLQVITPTPRCAVPTLDHGALPADPKLTQKIGQLNRVGIPGMGNLACLGAYAAAVRGGVIEPGAKIELLLP